MANVDQNTGPGMLIDGPQVRREMLERQCIERKVLYAKPYICAARCLLEMGQRLSDASGIVEFASGIFTDDRIQSESMESVTHGVDQHIDHLPVHPDVTMHGRCQIPLSQYLYRPAEMARRVRVKLVRAEADRIESVVSKVVDPTRKLNSIGAVIPDSNCVSQALLLQTGIVTTSQRID
jgi:hypothetical protein